MFDQTESNVFVDTAQCAAATERVGGRLAAWQARRLAAHVDANLAEKISTRHLAKLVNLSPSHFSRVFKCTFGLPPHAWVMRRRMERAQALMLTTSAKLSEIATSCGMTDQAHFTRRFQRVAGETPYVWRRRLLA